MNQHLVWMLIGLFKLKINKFNDIFMRFFFNTPLHNLTM
jgi:hypothetical protein